MRGGGRKGVVVSYDKNRMPGQTLKSVAELLIRLEDSSEDFFMRIKLFLHLKA